MGAPRHGEQPQNTASEDIPSIEITQLGTTGFNAAVSRTAIGLAVNLPQFRNNETYQFQNNLSDLRGNHVFKMGADVRRQYVKSFFFPTIRGRLAYASLNDFVNDIAGTATINKPLPGGEEVNYYRWWDQYDDVQDEWRVKPTLTLSLGLRYELPGNNIQSLIELNEGILQANGNNPVFGLTPVPKTDTNNFQPRLGFNWSPWRGGRVPRDADWRRQDGPARRLCANARLRISQHRPQHCQFVPIRSLDHAPGTCVERVHAAPEHSGGRSARGESEHTDAHGRGGGLPRAAGGPVQPRTAAAIRRDMVARVEYVGTFGKDLFQTLDGNPNEKNSLTRVIRRRLHPAARERGRILVSLAPDRPRAAVQRRARRRGSLHLERTPRYRIRGLRSIDGRSSRRAGLLRPWSRQGSFIVRPAAPADRQLRLGAAVDARPAGCG